MSKHVNVCKHKRILLDVLTEHEKKRLLQKQWSPLQIQWISLHFSFFYIFFSALWSVSEMDSWCLHAQSPPGFYLNSWLTACFVFPCSPPLSLYQYTGISTNDNGSPYGVFLWGSVHVKADVCVVRGVRGWGYDLNVQAWLKICFCMMLMVCFTFSLIWVPVGGVYHKKDNIWQY